MLKNKNNSSVELTPSTIDVSKSSCKSGSPRILKANLVYIIGLTKELANKKVTT